MKRWSRSSVPLEVLESRQLLASTGFTPQTFEARAATSAITVDGRLDEPAWAAAQPITTFYLLNAGGASAPPTTTAKLLWDRDNLYVGFSLKDTDISSAGTGHDTDLFNGDVAELVLKPS